MNTTIDVKVWQAVETFTLPSGSDQSISLYHKQPGVPLGCVLSELLLGNFSKCKWFKYFCK